MGGSKLTCYLGLVLWVYLLQVTSHPATLNINANVPNVSNLIVHLHFFERNGSSKMNEKSLELILTDQAAPFVTTKTIPTPSSDKFLALDSETESQAINVTLTAEEEMQLKIGIDVDYFFNETRSSFDHPAKLISSPGCPVSGVKVRLINHPFNRDAWVQFGNPPRCFLVGTQGPCPVGMKIGHQPNSTIGVCKCSCYFNVDTKTYNKDSKLFEDVFDPYFDLIQKFCYAKSGHFAEYEGNCYQLNTRGPCPPGEVFLLDTELGIPRCKVRECPEVELKPKDHPDAGYRFLFKGNCSKEGDDCESSVAGVVTEGSLLTTKYNPNPTCLESYDVAFRNVRNYVLTNEMCADANQRYSEVLRRCVPFTSATRLQVG